MASNINDTGVNKDYPVAGQDNDSQGFRDNFYSASKRKAETFLREYEKPLKSHSFKKEEAINYIKMKRWIAFKPKIIYNSILN